LGATSDITMRSLINVNLGAFTAGQTKSTTALGGFGSVGGFLLSVKASGAYHANAVYAGIYFDTADYSLNLLSSSGYVGTAVSAVLNSDGTISVTVSTNAVDACFVSLQKI